ncbi:carboxylesterase/lipase family protein [Paenarthrobacter sp. NPDC056912]|uniref:carboxylesterase/lipase family protein n=1 Tax=Paenarthrobacter sp. NPDC056912 TaxID=3345965 RepID=UPI00366B5D75
MTQPSISPDYLEITTAAGAVRGCWREGSAAFLGIPFAEPPVGALRFAAPVPHRPWEGVRDALEFGATPQRVGPEEVTIIPEPSVAGDSTLNVNVFTPSPGQTQDRGLPVLVWIHGGGYFAGSPASPWYDGSAFNRDGVVTVSVSYRLGFDGFGWIADAPHNRGVLDWILALEWVRDNIAAFGGDPSRVTIAGQSAGGGAALTLLTVPRAQELFERVISLSGVPTEMTLEQAEATGRRLAWLGGVESSRAALATLPEQRVLELQAQLSHLGQEGDPILNIASVLNDGLAFAPVVDGMLIPRGTADAMRAGQGSGKALMLGTTDHEFNMMLAGAGAHLPAEPDPALLTRLGVSTETAGMYAADRPGLDSAQLLGQFVTDSMFRAPALRVAEARAGSTAPTWMYRFAWRSPVTGEAGHCLDVPFFFDLIDAERVTAIAGSEPPASLAADVHGAAVSFIRTGQPGWMPWDAGTHQIRVYDLPTTDIDDGYADVRPLQAAPSALTPQPRS